MCILTDKNFSNYLQTDSSFLLCFFWLPYPLPNMIFSILFLIFIRLNNSVDLYTLFLFQDKRVRVFLATSKLRIRMTSATWSAAD